METYVKQSNMKTTINYLIVAFTIVGLAYVISNSKIFDKPNITPDTMMPQVRQPQNITTDVVALPMSVVSSLSMSANPKRSPKPKMAQDPKTLAYIKRFKGVAKSEFHKYNIPPAIKLAQGILESNSGTSSLSKKSNNHFGIKCFSKKCSKGHCTNFHDDGHKDFFRNYDTAWESYRAHSKFLNKDRYRHLQKLCPYDYHSWAKGLRMAGYATDSKYPEKLINVINTYRLDTIK